MLSGSSDYTFIPCCDTVMGEIREYLENYKSEMCDAAWKVILFSHL